jgi:hypothetical protein
MNAPKGKAPAPTKTQGAYGEQLSFLPPPPFCPTWPKRGTLADKALGMLMDGRMIDHPDFENSTLATGCRGVHAAHAGLAYRHHRNSKPDRA